MGVDPGQHVEDAPPPEATTEAGPAETFPDRVGVVQTSLAKFRVPVFEALGERCTAGLGVFADSSAAYQHVKSESSLEHATFFRARNVLVPLGPLRIWWQRGIGSFLREWDPSLLVVEANPRSLSSRYAVRWMHARGRPVIGWGLGTLTLGKGLVRLRRRARIGYLRSFDAMMAYGSRAAREYEAIGFPADRIHVTHNAATPRPDAPPPDRPPAFAPGGPTVLFVGRLLPGKRVDVLLRACAALAPEERPRLRIVGDGPERAALEAVARDVFPDAEFLGALFGQELAAVFASADLFVLPGLGGLAVQEAMAHALPIIVADGDGTQFDLVTEANGWHVTPGDTAALTARLRDALAQPERLRRMGAESYRVVAEEINLDTLVAKIVRALHAVRSPSVP